MLNRPWVALTPLSGRLGKKLIQVWETLASASLLLLLTTPRCSFLLPHHHLPQQQRWVTSLPSSPMLPYPLDFMLAGCMHLFVSTSRPQVHNMWAWSHSLDSNCAPFLVLSPLRPSDPFWMSPQAAAPQCVPTMLCSISHHSCQHTFTSQPPHKNSVIFRVFGMASEVPTPFTFSTLVPTGLRIH